MREERKEEKKRLEQHTGKKFLIIDGSNRREINKFFKEVEAKMEIREDLLLLLLSLLAGDCLCMYACWCIRRSISIISVAGILITL